MMLGRVLRIVLPFALAGALGAQSAHADIYTWVDASGALNVSNLAPPDDARVIRVTKDAPAPAVDAQALAERVKQLEAQVAQGQRPLPPPVDYAPPPMPVQYPQYAPPVVQYIFEASPGQYSAPQYSPPQYYAPQYDSTDYWAGNTWCDPNWLNCGWGPYGWAPGFYPPSVIVVNNPKRGRPGNGFVPGHRPPTRPPIVTPFTTNPVAPLNTSSLVPQMGRSIVPQMGTSMSAPQRLPTSFHRG
jgi:hypothetical protein